ncbi:tetratricopeptide (TPR) domain protein [Prevotella sp. CAG:487]|nr:tetratricopeptide (TPR) domain protein [Prevotella sp. CAG:487]
MYDNRNLHDAVMLMKKAEDVADEEDDSFLHFRIAAALAMMNRETGNRTLVMKYRRRELDAARRSGSERHMARAWNDMAAEYRRTGDTDSFMTCMNRCLPLTSKAAPEAQALIRTNMGCYHMNRGDTARAMQLFTMAYTASPDRLASLMLGDIYACWATSMPQETTWTGLSPCGMTQPTHTLPP